ncbi:hypothetical protein W02_30970 [Nitrospira sp. KM1]|nr:hypothetical protein W02_30970 [Nitrospira sp. KM1]
MRYVGGTGPEPSEENMQQFAEAERENEQRFKEDQLRYIEFKRKAESATDPLDTLSTVAVAALKATDLQTLAEVPKTIRGITRAALASIKPSGLTHWNPAGGLADKWVMHLINFTSRLLEVARKEGLSSVEVDILQTTDDCVCQLIEKEEEQAIIKIMGFWKQVSNAAIGNNKSVFIWLITKYAAIGETALERELKSISDETFRHLGWLGENLLDKTGYTEKAIMYDLDYSTEFDELLNALLSFGSIYSSKYSKQYPLIYFDAIRVVFIKLSKLTKGLPSDSEIKNSLYACISSIASFIDAALRSSNSDGAALAVIRIRQCYEELVTIQLHERAAEVVSLLVDAAVSAVQSDCKSHLIPEGIGEYLTKLLIKCPYKDKIASAVRDSLIKSHGTGHSKVWGFVTELGKRMGTNFGLMFDEKTGKIYANDDPRRQ